MSCLSYILLVLICWFDLQGIVMNAMQKVAWWEFAVSIVTIAFVSLLYPVLGNGATGAFGLFGFLALSRLFLRKRNEESIIDERDRNIEQKAIKWGISAAWQFTFLALMGIVLWNNSLGRQSVSLTFLNWLIWLQFAVCYCVKGLVGILSYRNHAA